MPRFAYPGIVKTFRRMIHERKAFPSGSPEWEWRSRAARKLVWLMRGVPVNEWSER